MNGKRPSICIAEAAPAPSVTHWFTALLVASLLAALCTSLPAFAGEAPAITVDSYKRTVEVQQANGSWRAYDGEELSLPFAIRTGKKSRVALSQGDTKIKINSNSELHLASAAPSPSSRAAGFIALIKQKLGAAIYKVEKHPGEFRVETPHLVSVVKGTRFTVTSGKQKSFVSVTEGLVEVTNIGSGLRAMARPGDVISSAERDDLSARQPVRINRVLGVHNDNTMRTRKNRHDDSSEHTAAAAHSANANVRAGSVSTSASVSSSIDDGQDEDAGMDEDTDTDEDLAEVDIDNGDMDEGVAMVDISEDIEDSGEAMLDDNDEADIAETSGAGISITTSSSLTEDSASLEVEVTVSDGETSTTNGIGWGVLLKDKKNNGNGKNK